MTVFVLMFGTTNTRCSLSEMFPCFSRDFPAPAKDCPQTFLVEFFKEKFCIQVFGTWQVWQSNGASGGWFPGVFQLKNRISGCEISTYSNAKKLKVIDAGFVLVLAPHWVTQGHRATFCWGFLEKGASPKHFLLFLWMRYPHAYLRHP